MTGDDRERRIEALLKRIDASADDESAVESAREVLDLDPENPEALFCLAERADPSQGEEEAAALLERAATELRRRIVGAPDLDDRDGRLLAAALERLCFGALLAGDDERVLALAEELISFDPEDETLGRTLLYRSLMVLGRFREVLERSLVEKSDVLFALHGRALALFCLSGPGPEASRALWDAIALEPDLPYYLLQYWQVPDVESDDEEEMAAWEICNLAGLLSAPWLADEERMGWFATAAILFGYLTDRLPDSVIEEARPHMERAGILALLQMAQGQMEALLQENEEMTLEEIDEMAIRLLREMSNLAGSA